MQHSRARASVNWIVLPLPILHIVPEVVFSFGVLRDTSSATCPGEV